MRLSKLQVLDLKGNELKSLPDGFVGMTGLRDLNVSMNLEADYGSIIPMIAKLKSLKNLDISYNNITREQAQPLIDALPDCRILNFDYTKHGPQSGGVDDSQKRNK